MTAEKAEIGRKRVGQTQCGQIDSQSMERSAVPHSHDSCSSGVVDNNRRRLAAAWMKGQQLQ